MREGPKLSVRLTGSASVAPGPEDGPFLLLVQPAQELLEARISLNLLDRVELVAQLVMRPGLVDEILAGMAGRSDVPPAFAARHNVVPSRGHLSVAECASFVHPVGAIFLQKHNYWHCFRQHWFKGSNPRLVSSTNSHPALSQNLVQKGKGQAARSTSRSGVQKWYARPVTLRIQALI